MNAPAPSGFARGANGIALAGPASGRKGASTYGKPLSVVLEKEKRSWARRRAAALAVRFLADIAEMLKIIGYGDAQIAVDLN